MRRWGMNFEHFRSHKHTQYIYICAFCAGFNFKNPYAIILLSIFMSKKEKKNIFEDMKMMTIRIFDRRPIPIECFKKTETFSNCVVSILNIVYSLIHLETRKHMHQLFSFYWFCYSWFSLCQYNFSGLVFLLFVYVKLTNFVFLFSLRLSYDSSYLSLTTVCMFAVDMYRAHNNFVCINDVDDKHCI